MRLNFKHTFTVFVFTVFFSSCLIEEGSDAQRKTEQGFFVYAYTADMVMSQYLFSLDLALKMDDFSLEADGQSKDEMMNVFFPKYEVTYTADTYTLSSMNSGGESEYGIQILTRGTSLRDENAHWSVLLAGKNKWIDIYRNAASEYRVQADEVMLIEDVLFSSTDLIISVTNLEVKYVDENSIYSYSISGNGDYLEKMEPNEDYLHSSYSVEYVFENKVDAYLIPRSHYSYAYYENMFRYRDGALSMTIPDAIDVNKTQDVRAVLSADMYLQTVEIEYQGVSEVWTLSDYRD